MTTRVATEPERLSQRSLHCADDDLVFGHPHLGSVLDASRLRRRFKKAIADAGVRAVRFHDLRHTFGTQAAAAGVPLRTLQEWMGHRDYKTTLIYADYAPRTHERALLEAAFGEVSQAGFHGDHDVRGSVLGEQESCCHGSSQEVPARVA